MRDCVVAVKNVITDFKVYKKLQLFEIHANIYRQSHVSIACTFEIQSMVRFQFLENAYLGLVFLKVSFLFYLIRSEI